MKKLIILGAAVLALVAATPQTAQAQKYQGQMNFTAGGSFSLTGLFLSAVNSSIGDNSDVTTTNIPGLNGMLDFGVTDRFSVGACYYYQSWGGKWTTYTDSIGVVQTGNWSYRITRQNVGLRALFHFGDNDDLDTYAGARFGYTFWSYKTDANNSLDFGKLTSRLWPQALFGMRYYFTENIGVNAEFAVGPPYYMMFGVNARFGGQ